MSFEVVLTEEAKRQLDEACEWYQQNAPHLANDWYNGLLDSLYLLEYDPTRFGIARESHEFPVEMRQLLYGVGKRKTHRAIFSVHGDRVVVRAIRHLAQRDLRNSDL